MKTQKLIDSKTLTSAQLISTLLSETPQTETPDVETKPGVETDKPEQDEPTKERNPFKRRRPGFTPDDSPAPKGCTKMESKKKVQEVNIEPGYEPEEDEDGEKASIKKLGKRFGGKKTDVDVEKMDFTGKRHEKPVLQPKHGGRFNLKFESEAPERHYITVHFADGNTIDTWINGTKDEIKKYYEGQEFQFGDTDEHPKDKMVKATKVVFKESLSGAKAWIERLAEKLSAEERKQQRNALLTKKEQHMDFDALISSRLDNEVDSKA